MTAVASLIQTGLAARPDDVRALPDSERDRLIISAVQVDGVWVIQSQYGDDLWKQAGGPTNRSGSKQWLYFEQIPRPFRSVLKEAMYRYMRRGWGAHAQPAASSVKTLFNNLKAFLLYLDRLKIKELSAVTPMVCSNYVAACKASREGRGGRPLKASVLFKKFSAVSILYELSQFTGSPMKLPPWGSAYALLPAGMCRRDTKSKTPLIPDEVFCSLFQLAYDLVKKGHALLDMRDKLEAEAACRGGQHKNTIIKAMRKCLATSPRF